MTGARKRSRHQAETQTRNALLFQPRLETKTHTFFFSMKLAALVSGGKDSCYALGLAQAAGHEVVVLLNLCPADATQEDTDSHCFQTVGHAAAPALAAVTGLPLLRRRLTGGSTSTTMAYAAPVPGDEVEDLTALLVAAAARFPGLEGVVSGAVGSDYQRLRVEHAAGRAGLVALAPL